MKNIIVAAKKKKRVKKSRGRVESLKTTQSTADSRVGGKTQKKCLDNFDQSGNEANMSPCTRNATEASI